MFVSSQICNFSCGCAVCLSVCPWSVCALSFFLLSAVACAASEFLTLSIIYLSTDLALLAHTYASCIYTCVCNVFVHMRVKCCMYIYIYIYTCRYINLLVYTYTRTHIKDIDTAIDIWMRRCRYRCRNTYYVGFFLARRILTGSTKISKVNMSPPTFRALSRARHRAAEA